MFVLMSAAKTHIVRGETMKTFRIGCRAAGAVCALAAMPFICDNAKAHDYVVSRFVDDLAGGTLRDVINALDAQNDPNSAIHFSDPNHPFPSAIVLDPAKGEMIITKPVVMTGPGATNLLISDAGSRIFEVGGGTTVKISGLHFQGTFTGTTGPDGIFGNVNGGDGGLVQGGVMLQDPATEFFIVSCYFDTCQANGGPGGNAFSPNFTSPPATGGNGGFAEGGAVANMGGDLFLTDCTFYNCSANGGRGGHGFDSGAGGKGGHAYGGALADIYGGSDIYIVNCTFASNNAVGGAGGMGGNAVVATGGIHGGNGGPGGDAWGGGIYMIKGCTDCTGIDHTTTSLNVCNPGAGGAGGSGPTAGTAGANGAAHGGGIYFAGTGMPNDELPIQDTIVGNNFDYPSTAIGTGSDVWGVFDSTGFNLIGNGEASSGWTAGFDLVGTAGAIDPRLGPLQNNGGQVMTMAPLSCSPVIDAATTGVLTTDQIGQGRHKVITSGAHPGDGSDIGAFELQSYPTDGSTLLHIVGGGSGGTVMVSWAASSCLILQEAANLQNPMWMDVTNQVFQANGNNEVFVYGGGNQLFFRLFHP
jgi:hypothetical protein